MRRFRSPGILLCVLLIMATLGNVSPAFAAPPTLKEAVDAAWAKQPEARALAARQDEMGARRNAAAALFPAPPIVALAQRTDRYNQNRGDRETEAEIAFPLWMPGTKDTARSLALAESDYLDRKTLVNKLRVAEKVRSTYWQARIAENEHHLAVHQASEATELMQDVLRRFKAGEVARTDANQAKITQHIAQAYHAQTEARAFRALKAFTALTGLSQLPETDEVLAKDAVLNKPIPQLAALSSTVEVNQARLAQVNADRSEPPRLAVGVTRERQAYSDSYENSVRIAIHIPLATQSRNAPRIAAANAELVEAQAALALEYDRIQAEIDAAKEELRQAQNIEALAQERYQLAIDTHNLHVKAFRLGEIDFVIRLRSENERFEAKLAFSRAQLEVGRAISQVNQALGLLP